METEVTFVISIPFFCSLSFAFQYHFPPRRDAFRPLSKSETNMLRRQTERIRFLSRTVFAGKMMERSVLIIDVFYSFFLFTGLWTFLFHGGTERNDATDGAFLDAQNREIRSGVGWRWIKPGGEKSKGQKGVPSTIRKCLFFCSVHSLVGVGRVLSVLRDVTSFLLTLGGPLRSKRQFDISIYCFFRSRGENFGLILIIQLIQRAYVYLLYVCRM